MLWEAVVGAAEDQRRDEAEALAVRIGEEVTVQVSKWLSGG
jgi:hypothetical protein